MPGIIGTNKALSDVNSRLQGLLANERKTNALVSAVAGGRLTRAVRPIVIKMLAQFVAENFKAKKDQSGSNFRAPSNEYAKWSRGMINKGTTVYVGANERRAVKHPGTASWSGRRTDYLWDMMFKNQGKGLREGINVTSTRTKSRAQVKFKMGPTNIESFVHEYPLKFFASGSNPFFVSTEQGRRLKAEIDKIVNQVKEASRG